MRFWIIATIVLAALMTLFAWREVRLNKKMDALYQDRAQLMAEHQSLCARLDLAEERLTQAEIQALADKAFPVFKADSSPATQRIAVLENQIRALQIALDRQPVGLTIPEYDPTRQSGEPQSAGNTPPKRGWGTEQVVGPPDTIRPGDAPTAWAPPKANAGKEWLAVGFEHAVDVAEIRIRETYNPGAISKVTALVNNTEVVLWEGTAAPSNTPRDFVVPVSQGVQTDSVIVHLDTTRVASWSEIDAVELVGQDGTRQWANSANASSTYADTTRSTVDFTY